VGVDRDWAVGERASLTAFRAALARLAGLLRSREQNEFQCRGGASRREKFAECRRPGGNFIGRLREEAKLPRLGAAAGRKTHEKQSDEKAQIHRPWT
jgi:hypothetical protein